MRDADIASNLAAVAKRLETARARSKHSADSISIVAVSKRHPAEAIAAAFAAGHRDFGENYALELVAKADELDEADIRWHFIGHLQRNKVAKVVGRAALIHAVDSERLVRAIDHRAELANIRQPILIAVNVADDDAKSGIDIAGAESLVRLATTLEHVECRGLMTMPPWPDDPETSRPHFARLRTLRDELATPAAPLADLSMGTSIDSEIAAEEGATLIRVGTAIFGQRPA